MIHGFDVGPILQTSVPVSHVALGLVTIFILCWFAGALIAGTYNSLIDAVALGTGVMIGTGIFALTDQRAEMTGSLFPLTFLSAALIVSLSACSYVKPSNAYLSTGGIAMYWEKAYGGTLITAFHALLMYFSMVIAQSFQVRSLGSYAFWLFEIDDSS